MPIPPAPHPQHAQPAPTPPTPPTPPEHPEHPDHAPAGLSRRAFVGASAAAAVAAAGLPLATSTNSASASTRSSAAARRAAARTAPRARNLILLVADGMSTGTLTLAEMVSRQRRNRESRWVSLWREQGTAGAKGGVVRAAAATYSADSLVTDSAAAASAWACGQRVNNYVLNITPDGRQQLPIWVRASQSGKRTGLVTTTRVTHATPAAFLTNCVSRDHELVIAEQMLARGCDVVLGGGARYFTEQVTKPHPNLRVVRSADQLRSPETARHAGPLLGVFNDSHMAFEIDRPEREPSLADMTRVALARLDSTSKSGSGFVLQVEGGRVDHAAHNNDAAALALDQLAFDDALAVVWEYTKDRDDTLVIATTDHGNANPGMTLYGRRSFEGLRSLLNAAANSSFDALFERLRVEVRHPDRPAHLIKLIEETRGIALDADERSLLTAAMKGQRSAAFRELGKLPGVLGGLLANTYGVGFVSVNHTADIVEVLAWGPGSQRIPPMGHNTDLHRVMVEALALGPGLRLPDMEETIDLGEQSSPD